MQRDEQILKAYELPNEREGNFYGRKKKLTLKWKPPNRIHKTRIPLGTESRGQTVPTRHGYRYRLKAEVRQYPQDMDTVID